MSANTSPSDHTANEDSPRDSSKISSIWLLAGSLVVTFLFLELIVRLMGSYDELGQFVFMDEVIRPYKYPTEQAQSLLDEYLASPDSYIMYDPYLGWTIRPNAESENGLYRSNSQGMRADRDFSSTPAADTIRIAIFGDSYTHSSDVPFEESWGYLLEQDLLARGYQVEVMNFGVGGYGIDQAYLRWKMVGQGFHPDIVVFGFQPENVSRDVTAYRGFENPNTGTPFFKPRFIFGDDGLVLINSPTPPPDQVVAALENFQNSEAAPYDYWYDAENYRDHIWYRSKLIAVISELAYRARVRQENESPEAALFDPTGEPVLLTEAIIEQWHDEVEAEGSRFVIVHLPHKNYLRLYYQQGTLPYQDLLPYFDENYTFVHTEDGFDEAPLEDYFVGHYNGKGNAVVANALSLELIPIIEDLEASR